MALGLVFYPESVYRIEQVVKSFRAILAKISSGSTYNSILCGEMSGDDALNEPSCRSSIIIARFIKTWSLN